MTLRIGIPRRKKTVIASVLTIIALASAAVALAAWLTMSNSQGYYKVGSLQPLTVTAQSTFPADGIAPLPGGVGSIGVKVSNPNGSPLTLTGWTTNGGGIFQSNDLPAGCNSSDFTVIPSDGTFTPVVIPANAVNFLVTIPKAYSLSASAGNSCQGIEGTTSNSTAPWRFIFST